MSKREVSFVVPGAPVPKGRPRVAANGHVYTPRRTKEYEAEIGNAWISLSPRPAPFVGDVEVFVIVSEGSREADIDNYLKVVLDGLNTLAWADDKQVMMIWGRRVRKHPNPRLEVTVREVEG